MRKIIVVLLALGTAACGTFQLGVAYPPEWKSRDTAQLDMLVCKEEARNAANTSERQAGNFLLGATLVGSAIAYEMEKQKQREVWKSCMEQRSYRIELATD